MSKTGVPTSFDCPATPLNTTVYAVRSLGNTVYSLRYALVMMIQGETFGSSNVVITSVDKNARDLALNASYVWTTSFAGKLDRFDLATKSLAGTLTLPASGSALGAMAMGLMSGRLVVVRLPASDPSFSAIVYSLPSTSMSQTDVVTEVIP
jgi:hypothetical protein